MGVYKSFDNPSFSVYGTRLSKTFKLNSGSSGIAVQDFLSGSTDFSGSQYSSLRINFYISQSDYLSDEVKFKQESPYNSLCYVNSSFPQHKIKFHNTGSVLSISQKHFGEQIKPKTFKLTDSSHPSGTVTLTDDGYGNIYAPSCSISASSNNLSSSDNYIGNIFYELGIVNILETGSFSHTPSVSSITFVNSKVSHSQEFHISASNLSTTIKFMVNSGSITGSDDTNLFYFTSASGHSQISESAFHTALSASQKINQQFSLSSTSGSYISASCEASDAFSANPVLTLSNVNKPNQPIHSIDNLPAITGSLVSTIGLVTDGFSGGIAPVNYTDILKGNFSLSFKSVHTIYTQEYMIKVKARDLNGSNNPTVHSGSRVGDTSVKIGKLKPALTGSNWAPYITTLGLYDDNYGLVAAARLSQPIKKIKWSDLLFKIKFDI
jgi:hypothetical protein